MNAPLFPQGHQCLSAQSINQVSCPLALAMMAFHVFWSLVAISASLTGSTLRHVASTSNISSSCFPLINLPSIILVLTISEANYVCFKAIQWEVGENIWSKSVEYVYKEVRKSKYLPYLK